MTALYKVQTKHLNEHSTLYGGQLLEWIDNYCLAKTEKYKRKSGEQFVTRSTNCEFLAPVKLGELIRLEIKKEKVKNTSLTFEYNVVCRNRIVAKGISTFVKIFRGKKAVI